MRRKRIVRHAIMFAVCMILLIVGVGGITNYMTRILEGNMVRQLADANKSSKDIMEQRLQVDLQEAEGLSMAINALGGPDSAQAQAFVDREVWQEQGKHLVLANAQGTGYSNKGTTSSLGGQEFFLKAMQGTPSFSALPVEMMTTQEQQTLVVTVPIQNGNAVTGVLLIWQDIAHYQELLNFTMQEIHGKNYLVKPTGQVLLQKEKAEATLDFTKEAAMLEKMQTERTGTITGKVENSRYYMAFSATAMNDWYLLSHIDDSALQAQKLVLRQVAGVVAALAAVVFLVLLAVLFVTEERKTKLMERIALYNQLTGLHNWQYLQNRFMAKTAQGQWVYAVLRIQDFQRVGTVFGYAIIARLLKEVATLLREEIKEGETAIHVSEDCFALLLKTKENRRKDEQRLDGIIAQLEQIDLTDGNVVYDYRCEYVGGACTVEPDARDLTVISRRGSAVMENRLKARQKAWGWYESGTGDQLSLQEALIPDLLPALKGEGFVPFFQPQFDLNNGEIVGAEVLARWRHPVHGILLPGVFVPILEASGCVLELDMIMLEQACKMMQGWLAQGLYPVPMSINISRLNLHRRDLLDRISGIVKRYGVPPNLIILETTEAAVSDNSEKVMVLAKRLKQAGFLISIDDFGHGSATYSVMKEIPLDVVKLSRSFLLQFQTGERARTILHHVVEMLNQLNANIVAEGVENEEQEAVIRETGCSRVQGFYYSKPLAAEEFEKLMFADNEE